MTNELYEQGAVLTSAATATMRDKKQARMDLETNLMVSYGAKQDHRFQEAGHTFLGVALDSKMEEIHI